MAFLFFGSRLMDVGFKFQNSRQWRFKVRLSSLCRIALIHVLVLLFVNCSYSQTLIVKWDFPNNPDDSVSDGGIPANAVKYIGIRGGAGTPAFGYAGFTTRCAGAQQWANGAMVKYWQVEFSTASYSQLTIRSKNKSFQSQDFGPRDWLVQYRIGTGGSWTTFGNFDIRTGNQWDSLPVTPLPAPCNNQPSLYIRWLMASNTPTQGNGNVTNDAFNFIDDVVVMSGCSIPTVAANPFAQTLCPFKPITPIVITNPNNIPGTTFSWTRDNTAILTGIAASGTSNPITGTLNSTSPQVFVTTTFTITANAGGCTSTTTAAVTVGDNTPPVFLVNPDPVHFCVEDIVHAFWNFAGDITPVRPDWHTFYAGGTVFDLSPANFSDDCTAAGVLILHWRVDLVGGSVITGTGQVSLYASNIIFLLGTSTITYWLEDQSGNLTQVNKRPVRLVIVHARPDITRNF
ncbi:MAG: hypothetical protein WCI48_10530 [Bacteroidota bacterium]|jgi:hypothetical protein